ncbi:DUF4340 domain-containing protein [Thermodesulfobacteriota bacterium]
MKAKTFIVLLVVLCILAGTAYFMVQKDKLSGRQALLGKKLFETLTVGSIDTIAVQSNEGDVTLKQGKDFWEVADRYHYRADFSKVSDLVKKIEAVKIGRRFDSSDEILARLSMHAPERGEIPKEQKGTRIVFKDKAGKELENFVIGSDAVRSDAFYIKRSNAPVIYLVDKEFKFLDKKPDQWLAKELVNVDEKDIALIACYDMTTRKKIYMIERPEQAKDLVLLDAPPEKKLMKYKLEQVAGVLSPFKIDDVVDPAKKPADTGFSDKPQFEFRLFNGMIYHIYPGAKIKQDSDKYYFKVAVSYSEPAAKTDADKKGTSEDLSAKAKKLNSELGDWTYIVSKWVYDSFATKMEDFFEKEKKDNKA